MSFITNLCCVKGHVGEVLIAVPVACVFTAASGVLNGTAVVPVAFRARVFFYHIPLAGSSWSYQSYFSVPSKLAIDVACPEALVFLVVAELAQAFQKRI